MEFIRATTGKNLKNVATLVAMTVNMGKCCAVIGAAESMIADKVSWVGLFQRLCSCDLDGVKLIAGDKHLNVLGVVFEMLSEAEYQVKMLKEIPAQEFKKAASEKTAREVEDGIDETLTYCDFPSDHCTRIRTK